LEYNFIRFDGIEPAVCLLAVSVLLVLAILVVPFDHFRIPKPKVCCLLTELAVLNSAYTIL